MCVPMYISLCLSIEDNHNGIENNEISVAQCGYKYREHWVGTCSDICLKSVPSQIRLDPVQRLIAASTQNVLSSKQNNTILTKTIYNKFQYIQQINT